MSKALCLNSCISCIWLANTLQSTSYVLSSSSARCEWQPHPLWCVQCVVCGSCSVVSDSCDPVDCSPAGSSAHGISRPEYSSGVPLPTPGIFPTQGLNPELLCFLHWEADSLPLVPPGKALWYFCLPQIQMWKLNPQSVVLGGQPFGRS